MAATLGLRKNTISQVRQKSTDLLNAIDDLNALADTWIDVGSWIVDATGNDPEAEGYDANDFSGNEGLMKDDLAAVLGATLTAINGLRASGHFTNLNKVRIS